MTESELNIKLKANYPEIYNHLINLDENGKLSYDNRSVIIFKYVSVFLFGDGQYYAFIEGLGLPPEAEFLPYAFPALYEYIEKNEELILFKML